jgi:hypothetical protein
VDTAPALAAVGIARAALDDPDAWLPGELVAALWRDLLARAGEPDLALRAAENLPFGAYAVIASGTPSAPSNGSCSLAMPRARGAGEVACSEA